MSRFAEAIRSLPEDARKTSFLEEGFITNLVNSGVEVDEETSMRLGAVFSCVRNISQDIATAPMHLFRHDASDPRKKEKAVDHPLYRLLHSRPNPETSAFNFKQSLVANVLLWGNGYAFKERNRMGEIIGLWNLRSDLVFPRRSDDGSEIEYQIGSRVYGRDQILHVPGLGFDGVCGRSCIQYSREPVSLGLAAEELGAKFFGSGAHLGGVISVQGELSDEAFNRTSKQFNDMYKGLENATGIPILEGGASFSNTTMPLKDAQYIETRKFSRNEIAMMFRMPPHLIGDLDRATFSNIEEQNKSYYDFTIMPWMTCFEQAFDMQVVQEDDETTPFFCKFNADALLRGNTSDRYEAHASAINSMWKTVNEVRADEDMNPLEGEEYDKPVKPLNMADKGGDPEDSELKDKDVDPEPEPEPDDEKKKRSFEDEFEKENPLFAERVKLKNMQWPKVVDMRLKHLGVDEKAVLDLAKEKSGQELKDAVIEYFGTRYEQVSDDMLAIMQPFSMFVMASAVSETGKGGVQLDNSRYAKFAKSYCDSYSKGYLAETKRMVLNAIDAAAEAPLRSETIMESSDGYDEAQSVSDAFEEERDSKQQQIARDQTNKALGAFLVMAYQLLGIKKKAWVGVGSSCPMCRQFIGRTVEVEKSFTEQGGTLEWTDDMGRVQTMTTQLCQHPPLHKGCDCQMQAV